jgi:hypothetical protein
MTVIWMEKRNGGLFPTDEVGEDLLARMAAPEAQVEITNIDLRSLPEHRLFFAVIANFWKTWPEYKHNYRNAEQLRAKLLIEAGHVVSDEYEAPNEDAAIELAAILRQNFERARAKGKYGFARIDRRGKKVYAVFETAKSISWTKLGQAKFNSIVNSVFEIIKAETGISIENIRQMWQAKLAENKGKMAA